MYRGLRSEEKAKLAKLVSYYIERGFPHDYILSLSREEREFYAASMEFYEERREPARGDETV